MKWDQVNGHNTKLDIIELKAIKGFYRRILSQVNKVFNSIEE